MIRIGRLAPHIMLLVILGFPPTPLAAAEVQISPAQASKFIHDMGKRIETLLDRDVIGDVPQLQAQLRDIIHESFDLDKIGRFALGRTWEVATAAQQQEYQELFALWTADTYAQKLGAERGGSLTVLGAQTKISATDALVNTQINRPNGTSIKADLRVHNSGSQMRIIDVMKDGVSMAVTQRDEFASVIKRRGLNSLIDDLKSRTEDIHFTATRR